jgi:hypothetical protein
MHIVEQINELIAAWEKVQEDNKESFAKHAGAIEAAKLISSLIKENMGGEDSPAEQGRDTGGEPHASDLPD